MYIAVRVCLKLPRHTCLFNVTTIPGSRCTSGNITTSRYAGVSWVLTLYPEILLFVNLGLRVCENFRTQAMPKRRFGECRLLFCFTRTMLDCFATILPVSQDLLHKTAVDLDHALPMMRINGEGPRPRKASCVFSGLRSDFYCMLCERLLSSRLSGVWIKNVFRSFCRIVIDCAKRKRGI